MRLSFEQYATEIKKVQTFLLHLLVSCMSICLLVEHGTILSIIRRDIDNKIIDIYKQYTNNIQTKVTKRI